MRSGWLSQVEKTPYQHKKFGGQLHAVQSLHGPLACLLFSSAHVYAKLYCFVHKEKSTSLFMDVAFLLYPKRRVLAKCFMGHLVKKDLKAKNTFLTNLFTNGDWVQELIATILCNDQGKPAYWLINFWRFKWQRGGLRQWFGEPAPMVGHVSVTSISSEHLTKSWS